MGKKLEAGFKGIFDNLQNRLEKIYTERKKQKKSLADLSTVTKIVMRSKLVESQEVNKGTLISVIEDILMTLKDRDFKEY